MLGSPDEKDMKVDRVTVNESIISPPHYVTSAFHKRSCSNVQLCICIDIHCAEISGKTRYSLVQTRRKESKMSCKMEDVILKNIYFFQTRKPYQTPTVQDGNVI